MSSDKNPLSLKEEWSAEDIKKYSSMLKRNNVPVIFDTEHFRRLLGLEKTDFYNILFKLEYQYHEVEIPKKKQGELRTLFLPSIKLKYMQRWILDNILYSQECNNEVTGFVPSKSIIDNAKPHIGQKYILKLDIQDFFPSISKIRVFLMFKHFGYTNDLSNTLSNICIYKNELPQGAPSSPYIANLVCKKMDSRFLGLCKKNNLKYTRYADDITISGGKSVYKFKQFFINIVTDEKFFVNKKKVKLLKNGDRKQVTGIVINEKLSVPKNIIRDLRRDIYYITKYGLNSHLKRTGNITSSNYKAHLFGKAKYIYMVDREKGALYLEQLNAIDWET
ncbi:RNA-directed DNA polymerase [Enterococcus faecalis]|nr:RNA-directed DNA polymerase [Enterococcus faecalis]